MAGRASPPVGWAVGGWEGGGGLGGGVGGGWGAGGEGAPGGGGGRGWEGREGAPAQPPFSEDLGGREGTRGQGRAEPRLEPRPWLRVPSVSCLCLLQLELPHLGNPHWLRISPPGLVLASVFFSWSFHTSETHIG